MLYHLENYHAEVKFLTSDFSFNQSPFVFSVYQSFPVIMDCIWISIKLLIFWYLHITQTRLTESYFVASLGHFTDVLSFSTCFCNSGYLLINTLQIIGNTWNIDRKRNFHSKKFFEKKNQKTGSSLRNNSSWTDGDIWLISKWMSASSME